MDLITTEDIYSVLSKILSKQNDFYKTDYVEELNELLQLGITKRDNLENLILKHRAHF